MHGDTTDYACIPGLRDRPANKLILGSSQGDSSSGCCGAGSFGVHDHAYYWPQFTPIPAPLEYGPSDIAIFTLSKLTGHAGMSVVCLINSTSLPSLP